MQIYYHNNKTEEIIDSYHPREVSYEALHMIFLSLSGSGSFLGLILSDQLILQFLIEDGAFWTELLNTQTQYAQGCYLSKPLAEQVLNVAVAGGSIDEIKLSASSTSDDYPFEWVERTVK